MRAVLKARKITHGALLAIAIAATFAPSALGVRANTPRVSTGGVKHVHGTTGQFDAVVNPNGIETSYFFEYGPTVAYGKSTKPEAVGKGIKGLKIGQSVTGILAGYHYRVVATYVDAKGAERVNGKDKSFLGGKSAKLRFSIPKGKEETEESTVAYGGTAELTGGLTGNGNTGHGLILQAVPYPYTGTFTALLGPILTNLSGHFVFKVASMKQNTEFRILTTDRRPLYSSIITIHVTPKIILHVRSAGGRGKYRIYGTVAPARLRGLIAIQELKPQKASSKREGPKAHTLATAPIKQGNSKQAKFSIVLTLSGTSRLRIYLKLPSKGNLQSGHSNEVVVHAPKVSLSKKKTKTKTSKGKHTGRHAGKKGKKGKKK
jgi:hypothetical protein